MAKEREILEYVLDIDAALANAERLNKKLEEIGAARARGEDTSALEQELQKEADGLGRLTQQEQKAGAATRDLVSQKEKLANVVTLLGGSFGGTIGNLGNVVELLLQAGPAAAGFAAAMAGVTVVVKVVKDLNEELERAIQKLKQLEEGQRRQIEGERAPAEQIEQALLGFGALEKGRAEDVWKYSVGLRGMGIPEELAMGIAPQAQVAGVGQRTAAMLALASVTPGGQMPGTPEEVSAAAARLTPEQKEQLAQQLQAVPQTGMGRRAIANAALDVKLMERDPERFKALFDPSQDALLVELAKLLGVAPEKAGPDAAQRWLEQLKALREERGELVGATGFNPDELISPGPVAGIPGRLASSLYSKEKLKGVQKKIELLEQLLEGIRMLQEVLPPAEDVSAPAGTGGGYRFEGLFRDTPRRASPFGLPASVPGEAAAAAAAQVTNIHNTANVGTMYNAPSKIPPRWPVARVGNNKHDIRSPAA